MTYADYDDIARGLAANRKARVIVAFASGGSARQIIRALKRRNETTEYIWVGSDAFYISTNMAYINALGSFSFRPFRQQADDFVEYYKTMSPWKRGMNSWYRQAWELAFRCSWTNATNSTPCETYSQYSDYSRFGVSSGSSFWIDSVHLLAHALHALIVNQCPEAFLNASLARPCVDGKTLLTYIRNVSFEGITGPVKLTSTGDNMGVYMIRQFRKSGSDQLSWEQVGWWYKSNDTLLLNSSEIQWADEDVIPTSLCSTPCQIGEITIYKDVSCCWDCYRCRDNEIIDQNATRCKRCPDFTWPDSETFSNCEAVDPQYMKVDHVIAVCLIVLALLGMVLCILVSWVFIKHRNVKLIKATNRDMSVIIMCGLVLAFVITLCFIVPPTTILCNIRRVGFHICFTTLYATLFVKTMVIYRIFNAGRRGKQRPTFINKKWRLIQVFCLVMIQVI